MAAGPFVMYQHALEDIARRLIDLQSNTFVVALVSQGYTPVPASHSSWAADIAANVITSVGYAERTLASVTVTRSTNSHVAQDAADITLSATATMRAKYAVIRVGDRPVYYCDLETLQTTGVEVTQLIIQFNALGLGRISNPN